MPAGHKLTYATIDEIVKGVCLDLFEGAQREIQYTHWAIKYINRWHMDCAREIKTIKLKMTPWKSIELPDDCVDWVAVGIQDGNLIKTFVHNRDIAVAYDKDANGQKIYNEDPADPINDIINCNTDQSNGVWNFMNYAPYGADPGRLFGLRMRDNGLGYFTEIRNEGSCEIQLRTNLASTTTIYLQYLATAVTPDKETLIHPYAKEMIAKGVHLERAIHVKDKGMYGIAKSEFDEEFNRTIDRQWDYNIEEIMEWMDEGKRMTPHI